MIIRTFFAAAVTAFALTACGSSPCDDLESQCNACNSPSAKTLCMALVATEDGNACQTTLDNNVYVANSQTCQATF